MGQAPETLGQFPTLGGIKDRMLLQVQQQLAKLVPGIDIILELGHKQNRELQVQIGEVPLVLAVLATGYAALVAIGIAELAILMHVDHQHPDAALGDDQGIQLVARDKDNAIRFTAISLQIHRGAKVGVEASADVVEGGADHGQAPLNATEAQWIDKGRRHSGRAREAIDAVQPKSMMAAIVVEPQ